MGGVIKAIETGYIQNEIQNSAYQYQKDIEKGDQVVVGLNKFSVEEKPPANLLRIDPEKEKFQKGKLARVKGERDNSKVQEALRKLKAAAQGTDNLLPPTLEAVKVYASLGEIADVLRGVFGEYRER
jgi:methylmalonyl-CoA mutase N-terminal domain/subunit